MEIKGGDGGTNRPQGRDLDETSGSGSVGSHRRDGPSRGRGLEKERESRNRQRGRRQARGLAKDPRVSVWGSQCPSRRGPSLEEGTKFLSGAHQVLISCSLQLESSLVEVRGADCEAG